ncbi:MAG: CoB--CoM heterodisulfide reductase iron-sulfur subunit B family protein [Armatimonadota bacterium]|nr:CoB--CoM heterodisulfide reductase iron-sulfur subunit B family protein [Armatimonadota bacterium]
MKYAYFPGCSLHSTAKEYDCSTKAVCETIGVELEEIPDWNCCGASSAHSLSHKLSLALPARNLGIAEKMGLDVAVPCAACYNRMRAAEQELRGNTSERESINKILSAPFEGGISVKTLPEIIGAPDLAESIRENVKKPLSQLKAACYYGCLLVRPPKVMGFDDAEDPRSLDNIVSAIGVETVNWPYKVECCGASFALTKPSIVVKLTYDILRYAKAAGANCIVCACPLCQANLDTRQKDVEAKYGEKFNLPIFYFTELLALAMDLPVEDCLKRHMVATDEVLRAPITVGSGENADKR